MPTRVESLAWTKPERDGLDKMWLDSGMKELCILADFRDHEIMVEGDALILYFHLRILLFLSLQ